MHRLSVQACSEHSYLNYYRPSCTFFDYFLGFGPKKGPQRAILALVERFSGQGGRSSKIRPNARWTPRSTTIAPGTMIRMLSATLGDVCDLGQSLNRCSNRFLVRRCCSGRRTMFGRIFDDRPPWPENRSTSSKMALLGHFWGPNSRTKPKPRHLVGKKIILTLLNKPMHREIISHRKKWVKIGDRNYSFHTPYYMVWKE